MSEQKSIWERDKSKVKKIHESERRTPSKWREVRHAVKEPHEGMKKGCQRDVVWLKKSIDEKSNRRPIISHSATAIPAIDKIWKRSAKISHDKHFRYLYVYINCHTMRDIETKFQNCSKRRVWDVNYTMLLL